MKYIRLFLFVICGGLLLGLFVNANAQMSKRVDKDGRVYIQGSQSKSQSDTTNLKSQGAQTTPSPVNNRNADNSADNKGTQIKINTNSRVEIYVTRWCPYCKKAINFLQSTGIPFAAYDIEKDAAAARRKNQLDSQKGVPFAIINGQPIHGFSEKNYLKALSLK